MRKASRSDAPSRWPLPHGARYLGPHEGEAPIEVTVVMRRRRGKAPAPASWPHAPRWSREEYGRRCGADPADLERLRGFARKHGLEETDCQAHRRVLRLRGTPQALQRAFGVTLGRYQPEDGRAPFVGCDRAPTLPTGAIAVLGLDRRPVARPHYRRPQAQPNASYTPLQVGRLYAFPEGTDGAGQTIAIIELGGGYDENDLAQYFRRLGVSPAPGVTAVSVDGGANQPGGDADAEVMLDIEVAGALAPAAKLVVYFAPNTDQGFYDAISQAAHDDRHQPSVISISWGGPEDGWSAQAREAMQSALEDAAALGVTVTAAAGDDGSADGVDDGAPHVDFPASSPYALACGGTTLVADGDAIGSETVWNETQANEGATGGGVSTDFPLPDWQQDAGVPPAPGQSAAGRGVPDVAGNADPLTGYQVRVDGQDTVIGGTSAVSPLWAALIARCNQRLGKAAGDVHAALYRTGDDAFRDIVQGDNGDYQASTGWDPCTGLGSPNGQALAEALAAQA
ncbi:S53 family peptidase [Fulvimonas soli]|jgi:kumamolisin|uniref:Kumamolisin n=1 Tax=Fulvimonas soli TaxID=155197 RepID=A0A316I369_9GAMM|nr:S53 family peptidase [Fulvimonas soli]PWK86826.1 kumamolisin [Fulvimonas soli]TNY27201.1 peptidase S53 [Fulvimonas soli]